VRELVSLYRPQLKVTAAYGIPHPLIWDRMKDGPEYLIQVTIDYPGPHENQQVPDEYVSLQVSLFRQNLELAVSLEKEIKGDDRLYFETSRANDEGPELDEDSYGLTGPIVRFQNLVSRLAQLDAVAAKREILSWPATDLYVFARLRIWAAGKPFLDPAHSADIFVTLPDTVFWGHRHQRDLLYAIRDRWSDLPLETRANIEYRLRNGAYPALRASPKAGDGCAGP
jgi:hypothetical protein